MGGDGALVPGLGGLSLLSECVPLKAMAMRVLLCALAGVPPLVGCVGKFAVLNAAVDGGLTWLAVAGAVASVIGAFYYLRLVYYMYFGSEEEETIDGGMLPVHWGFLMASAAIMVVGVINLFGVDGAAAAAAASLVN